MWWPRRRVAGRLYERRDARRQRPVTKLTVGLGYIPSVQFAQFYRAQQQGYYRDAGLDVTFQNGRSTRTWSRSSARARWTSAWPTARASFRPSARASRSSTRRRSTPSFPTWSLPPAERPDQDGRGPQRSLAGHSRADTDRAGSCSRRCWRRLDLTTDDVTIHEYPDFGQGVGLAAGPGRLGHRLPQQRAHAACAERLCHDPAHGRPDRASAWARA